jgi:hypothetical protein
MAVFALSFGLSKTGFFHSIFFHAVRIFGHEAIFLSSIPIAILMAVVFLAIRLAKRTPIVKPSRYYRLAGWLWYAFFAAGIVFSLPPRLNVPDQFGGRSYEIIMMSGVFSIGVITSFGILFFANASRTNLINTFLIMCCGYLYLLALLIVS